MLDAIAASGSAGADCVPDGAVTEFPPAAPRPEIARVNGDSRQTRTMFRRCFDALLSIAIGACSVGSAGVAGEAPLLPPFKYVPQELTDANRPRVLKLYDDLCSGCHGHGEGRDNGLALFGAKHAQLNAAAIHFGRVEQIPKTRYATPVVMPAFGNQLTPVQIGELVAYIMTFRAPWPPR